MLRKFVFYFLSLEEEKEEHNLFDMHIWSPASCTAHPGLDLGWKTLIFFSYMEDQGIIRSFMIHNSVKNSISCHKAHRPIFLCQNLFMPLHPLTDHLL